MADGPGFNFGTLLRLLAFAIGLGFLISMLFGPGAGYLGTVGLREQVTGWSHGVWRSENVVEVPVGGVHQ